MSEENKRPETPDLDGVKEESSVSQDISNRLGDTSKNEVETASDEPKPQNPNMVDINNMTTEQVQTLQELFANTPRRKKEVDNFNTVELRQIDGKTIVEWGRTYFDLKTDTTLRKDVMKTMIPVRFHGTDKFVDILWKEDFMTADKITCKIIAMDTKKAPEVVGTTFKRATDGSMTSQEVEMYVNKVIVTLTVKLPDETTVKLNSNFAN